MGRPCQLDAPDAPPWCSFAASTSTVGARARVTVSASFCPNGERGTEPLRRKGRRYPPLCEMSGLRRREFHEALLDANRFEDLSGKLQAAILEAE